MKKLKMWSMMMLMVTALLMIVECGGNDDGGNYKEIINNNNSLSPELEKLCKLANIKYENYDWGAMSEKLYADSTYIPFIAHEKNSDNFHIWILDKSYNTYYAYNEVVKSKIDYYLGYGESVEMYLDSLHSGLTIISSKIGSGWLVYSKYLYKSNSYNPYTYYNAEVGGNGEINIAYYGNIIWIPKNGTGKLVYEIKPNTDSRSDVQIRSWYNNSVALKTYGINGFNIYDQNFDFIVNIHPVLIENNIHYMESGGYNVEGIIELTDYDKAIYWKTQCYDVSNRWVGMSDIYIDLVKLSGYFPVAETVIKLPDMGKEGVKYSLEVISSDSKNLNVRITLISYSGRKEIVDATIDKQALYDMANKRNWIHW